MLERLTPDDLINLYVETPSAPARVGAVAVLEAGRLLDPAGNLRLSDIRAALAARLDRVPRLRQIIHRSGPLGGRPVWVDDPAFRVERHVQEVKLPEGVELNDLAARLVTLPFDRAHPLWRLWFVTGLKDGLDEGLKDGLDGGLDDGLGDGRVGLVFGMHHVMADGATTVRMIGALMDPGRTETPPSSAGRSGAGPRRAGRVSWRSLARIRHAPRTSLNRHAVGPHRRLAALTLDLAEVKEAAHRYGGKVNDVVLALAAGGVRELLIARGEPVDGVWLHASVAVSLRGSRQVEAGNRTGAVAIRLPLDADPSQRLRLVAGESAEAKAHQPMTAGNALLVWMARLGLLRRFSRHQQMINIVESNLAGPPERMYLLGSAMTGIVPIGTLAGNIFLGFLALSYAGRLTIAVQADADRYPDLPRLLAAMRREVGAVVSPSGDVLSSAVQSSPGSAPRAAR